MCCSTFGPNTLRMTFYFLPDNNKIASVSHAKRVFTPNFIFSNKEADLIQLKV